VHLSNNPFLALEVTETVRNSHCERLLKLARDTLIGRIYRGTRKGIVCSASRTSESLSTCSRETVSQSCHSLALSYTRYINPRSNGFFLSRLRLFIGRREKSYFEPPRYYPHRESCIASALFVLFVVDAYARGRSSACYIPRRRRTLTFLLLSSLRARPVQSEEESCEPRKFPM